MWPDPLHPAVVHLPVALAALLPIVAVIFTSLIWKGFLPAKSWVAVILLQALLLGSGGIAAETGEREEERVEDFVAERHIEDHESAAERFLAVVGMGVLALGLGLLPGGAGQAGRVAGAAFTLVVLAAGVSVGHSGGALVYEHGAAAAYQSEPGSGEGPVAAARRSLNDEDSH